MLSQQGFLHKMYIIIIISSIQTSPSPFMFKIFQHELFFFLVFIVVGVVKMGVGLLVLWGALQAMSRPALCSPPAPDRAQGSSPDHHCSTSGSATASAASPPAHAATAPYTCRLQGGRWGETSLEPITNQEDRKRRTGWRWRMMRG